MAVTLPFVLLLIDYWPLGRLKVDKNIIFRLVLEKIPLFSLTAVFSLFTILTHLRSGAIASVDKLPLDIRIGNALLSYVKYMVKMFWPDRLAILYPHPIDLPFGEIIGATFLLMVITVMVILVRKRHPYLIMGWFLYLGTLVPVIGLVQAGVQAMADRFTYIPLIGLWVMMVYGISEILSGWRYRRTILLPSGILILFILTIITMRQVNQWQNSIKLFTHTLAVTAPNPLIHNNLGVTFMRQRKDPEALDQFRKALKIRPSYADAHSNLGSLLAHQGKDQEAMAHFVQTLQMKPENAEAHHALGVILTKQGKRAEAVVHLSEAVRINPHYEEALYNLGTGLLQLGRVQEAIYYFNQALRINPNNAKTHHNLGLALASQGKTQEAISHYEQSLRTNPESADAHFSLASLLKQQGRDKDALFHFKEALRMNPSDGQAHYELGTILFRQGINEEAVAHLVEAVRIIPNYGEAHLTLGMVYLGMGKKDLALTEYKILKTINPNLANTLYQNISKASH